MPLIIALILVLVFLPLGVFVSHVLWLVLLIALILGVAHALTRS